MALKMGMLYFMVTLMIKLLTLNKVDLFMEIMLKT